MAKKYYRKVLDEGGRMCKLVAMMKPDEKTILRYARRKSGVEARELTKRLLLSPQWISAAMGRLELAGLLTYERIPGDRRRKVAKITMKGRRAIK